MTNQPESLHQVISRIIRDTGPDGRLAPERSVAEDLGISRAAVRKAMAVLESEGRVIRQVGRGTFLRDVPIPRDVPVPGTLEDLTARVGPQEAMQSRLLLEPELAALAAVNATKDQISRLEQVELAMRQCRTWADYEALDSRFHRSIAESAGNTLLLFIHGIVDEVRRVVVWSSLAPRPDGPPTDYSSFAEHAAIVQAIWRRDRKSAAEAMRRHLRTTNERLFGRD